MIKGGPFAGVAPKYASHLLPNNAAQTAKNCLLTSGELRPLKAPLFVWDFTGGKSGTKKTIYRYRPASTTYWFHWLEDVNAVASPLANDTYDRVYWTGEAEPRMTTLTAATTGGGAAYPIAHYKLGIPAPASAATATPGGGVPSDESNIQSRAYVYTYVSAYGEEGPPATASSLVDVTDGDSVTVGVPSTGPADAAARNITHKNIYRLNSGVYQFLTTVTLATTEYVDTTANTALGSGITSTEYDPPPSTLKGLFKMSNGSLAGYTDDEFCISEPYLPHAWPVRYRVPFAGGIVSAGAFGNSVLVTTANDKPYVLSGSDPGSMFREQFEIGYSCASKRGTVDMGTFIAYPSPAGIVICGTGSISLATKDVIDEKDFNTDAAPSTMLAAKYGENLVWFSTVDTVSSGFIFNMKSGDLTTTGIYATAAYTDPGTGALYLVVDGEIVQFDAGAELEIEWESKDFILGKATNFSRGQVRAESYPVTLEVYADGNLKATRFVNSKAPFTLPGKFRADEWRYKIKSFNAVKSVAIANSVSEL